MWRYVDSKHIWRFIFGDSGSGKKCLHWLNVYSKNLCSNLFSLDQVQGHQRSADQCCHGLWHMLTASTLSVQYWQLRGMFTSVRCVQLLLPNLFSRDQVQGHQRSADQGRPVLWRYVLLCWADESWFDHHLSNSVKIVRFFAPVWLGIVDYSVVLWDLH